MSDAANPRPPDHIQNALEVTCDALILEQISLLQSRLTSSTRLHVEQAIASLGIAIAELRLARDDDASTLALGFVVRTVPERPRRGESRRRRSA